MYSNKNNKIAFPKSKRKRRVLNLQFKLEIINRLERGQSVASVGKLFGLANSTIRTIDSQKEKFKKIGRSCAAINATEITLTNRSEIMVHMEKLLKDWCHENYVNNVQTTYPCASGKALEIFNYLKPSYGDKFQDTEFTASRGWYERFIRRNNLYYILRKKYQNNDFEEEKKYLSYLETIIVEGNYSPRQVFNVIETGLFWRHVPLDICSDVEVSFQEFKKSDDRLSLLLGANASGDFKLKPLVVCNSDTSATLNEHLKELPAIIFKTNESASVSASLFEEWFLSYFIPEVENFCKKNNLVNKALLILGNATAFPPYLTDINSQVKIIFLPKDTAILQPMNLDTISVFRAYYLQNILVQAIHAVTGSEKSNLLEFYKSFSLKDAVDNILVAWDEISLNIINESWKTLCPFLASMHSFHTEKPCLDIINEVTENIIEMGNQFGFDIHASQVDDILSSHSKALISTPINELDLYGKYLDERPSQQVLKPFDTAVLNKFFGLLNKAMELISERDPNSERSTNTCEKIRESCQCYVDVYNQKNGEV